ncbi:hypothetical protein CSB11_00425 [Candidatus Campbellbacteria bacterium]|nr:MAG: hypothetical protein CSB11_00425 [Candidatus Campbellbacteria bacterium]
MNINKISKIFLNLVILLAVFVLGIKAEQFLHQDYCLDAGGALNSKGFCEFSKENKAQKNSSAKTEITWIKAVDLIKNNPDQIQTIFQTHNLDISITMKDGQKFSTKESRIDEIFEIINQCGEKCKGISLATE